MQRTISIIRGAFLGYLAARQYKMECTHFEKCRGRTPPIEMGHNVRQFPVTLKPSGIRVPIIFRRMTLLSPSNFSSSVQHIRLLPSVLR